MSDALFRIVGTVGPEPLDISYRSVDECVSDASLCALFKTGLVMRDGASLIKQHFVISNYNENVIFAAYRPLELAFPSDAIVHDFQDSLYSRRPFYSGISYDGVSRFMDR